MSDIEGLDVLEKKLVELGAKLGKKHLRGAVGKALNATVREMRSKAPVGKGDHKSYQGNKLKKGNLRKSIRKSTDFDRRTGKAFAKVGVLQEAFYGVAFLDKGIHVTSRRASGSKRSDTTKKTQGNEGRRATSIKPYTITGRKWFKFTFLKNEKNIIRDFKTELKKRIDMEASKK